MDEETRNAILQCGEKFKQSVLERKFVLSEAFDSFSKELGTAFIFVIQHIGTETHKN